MRLYAHRGSAGSCSVENTLPAVSACLLDGADGVEVDLRLAADGVLVVSHDPTLRRVAGTAWPSPAAPVRSCGRRARASGCP